jgi:hypothetical protein
MNKPREFDKIYSINYIDNRQGNYVQNNNYYFDGYPFLRNIKVKAISIRSYIDPKVLFLTLSDRNKNIKIYNFPFNDLIIPVSANNSKLRLFNLDGVDLLNSYWSVTTVPLIIPEKMFTINFYY